MGRSRVILVVVGVVALLLLAACGGGDDSDAESQATTQETVPEPAPPEESPPEPPEEAPAEPPPAPPEEPEAPADPPADVGDAPAGATTSVTHGVVFEADGVDQAPLCVAIEVNPPQEGLEYEVVITNVDSGVMFPPMSGEVGSGGKVLIRTNLPADVTYSVLVRVGEASEEHELEVASGSGSDDCAL